MGKRRGASYMPDYDAQPSQQGILPAAAQARPINSSGEGNAEREAVDSWRAYRNDESNLQFNASQHFRALGDGLNPAAAAYQPQVQSRPHFIPYQPLRFSNGVQENRRYSEAYSAPATRCHTHQLANRPRASGNKGHVRNFFNDVPLPSVETDIVNHVGPRAGLEVLRRAHARQSSSRRTASPPAPEASDAYLAQARLPANVQSTPKRLLVVLDLNGTLVLKIRKRNTKIFKVRPGVPRLLDYLFNNHFVMVYTSSQPQNAATVVNMLLSNEQQQKLVAVWARDKLDLNEEQFVAKVQVYKKLEKIWADEIIQAKRPSDEELGGKWDQSNTVLVDDSILKALAQPHNLLQVPEFLGFGPGRQDKFQQAYNQQQEDILRALQAQLEELKWQTDVSRLIWQWQTGQAEPLNAAAYIEVAVNRKLEKKEHTQHGADARKQSNATNVGDDAEDVFEGFDALSVTTKPSKKARKRPDDYERERMKALKTEIADQMQPALKVDGVPPALEEARRGLDRAESKKQAA